MNLSYVVLYVDEIQATVEFYQKAFGLKHRLTHESGEYAEMDTGGTTLAFCSHRLAANIVKTPYAHAKKNSLLGSQITLEPEDVKTAYRKAIEQGAVSLAEPEVKPWNFEVAMVTDNSGHIVELAKKL